MWNTGSTTTTGIARNFVRNQALPLLTWKRVCPPVLGVNHASATTTTTTTSSVTRKKKKKKLEPTRYRSDLTMSDDGDDPLKVITSDPVLRRQFLRSPRRQARERGASDDRPPRGGPFENSIIDDDKEEYIAMAVWIALALFAVAVSVVVARGPHLDVGTRVLRRGSGYSRVSPPVAWRPGSLRSNASQLRSQSSESAEQMERTRGNKAGAAGPRPGAANASVAPDEATRTTGGDTAISKATRAAQLSSSMTRSRDRTTEEDGGSASEQQIILW
ncbi:uncharacterized protein [Dermacentor albipictus]|uniref:uncharacterized protein isoform X2 n=1 Tax=Dermacentor albipictus TaxID=60249 RepID=UPI0038FC82B5